MANPLGNLCQNLTHLLEQDPDKYRSFVERCAEELELAKAKPEPFACLEIDELTSDRPLYVNVLVWPRVPAVSERDPAALPLCGGVLGHAGGAGINRADAANVAVNNADAARELIRGNSSHILLDFLEHRNPARGLSFDRGVFKLPWRVREDVKFVGRLDDIVGSFENGSQEKSENGGKMQPLLTPTPKSLLKNLYGPAKESSPKKSELNDCLPNLEGSKASNDRNRASNKVLIQEYDSKREAEREKSKSDFEKNIQGKMIKSVKRQNEIGKTCDIKVREDLKEPFMKEVLSREVTLGEVPMVGLGTTSDGKMTIARVYFPCRNRALEAQDILVNLEENRLKFQSSVGHSTSVLLSGSNDHNFAGVKLERAFMSTINQLLTLILCRIEQ